MSTLILLGIGLAAGVLSGMFGIGGGIIIIPALLYLVKLKEVQAIGTSLAALIPPVGLLGAYEYYRHGDIHLRAAALIAAGLFVGAFFWRPNHARPAPRYRAQGVRRVPAGGRRADAVFD